MADTRELHAALVRSTEGFLNLFVNRSSEYNSIKAHLRKSDTIILSELEVYHGASKNLRLSVKATRRAIKNAIIQCHYYPGRGELYITESREAEFERDISALEIQWEYFKDCYVEVDTSTLKLRAMLKTFPEALALLNEVQIERTQAYEEIAGNVLSYVTESKHILNYSIIIIPDQPVEASSSQGSSSHHHHRNRHHHR